MRRVEVAVGGATHPLSELAAPLDLERLAAGRGPWEVELGFGKGRYLLARAASEPARRFLGIELAAKYYRWARERADRRRLTNVVLVCGEAAYLLSAVLPGAFADAVHVYFPDPWPKTRHHKRRLFDPQSIDLIVGLLRPGGRLYFATDHLEYGAEVRATLTAYPVLDTRRVAEWEGGSRTNYEAKYVAAGRPILRLVAERCDRAGRAALHPEAIPSLLAAAR